MNRGVINHYHALHRIPEPAGQEYKTSAYVREALETAGYQPVPVGSTGVYADLVTDVNLPWILLRADMDALRITEDSGLTFASEHPGVMHACGHDAHTSMLLTVACEMAGKKLPQNIRFVFQPAEETTQGAEELLKNNVMPERCMAAFAMHVWPGVPYGELITKKGPMMASSDVYRVKFHGRSVHCSKRETGADALLAAVELAAALPEIELLAEKDGTMLFCGSIHSGASHNVVPDEAELWGTLRTFSEDKQKKIIAALEKRAAECGDKQGVQTQISWEGGCPAVCNHEDLVERVCAVMPEVKQSAVPVLAGEDFALFQRQCPGVMLWLGLGDWHALHTKGFYVPDALLPKGVEAWKNIMKYDWTK